MPPDTLGLDPEVHELLLDIARDESSTLLRVPRGKLLKYTAAEGRAERTGLSSAERHLVKTHRVEVALALRDLCRSRLWEHPEARYHVMRPVTRTTFFEVPNPLESVARGIGALEPLRELDEATGVEDLLEACIRPTDAKQPTITQLAAASLRLEPTDQARIYCAIDLKYACEEDSAMLVLKTVLRSNLSVELRAYALMNFGCIESIQGNCPTAFDAYHTATNLQPELSGPLMSALVLSASAQGLKGGVSLAQRVDDEYSPEDAAVAAFCSIIRSLRDAHRATWNRAEKSFYSKLAGPTESASARILNEICN